MDLISLSKIKRVQSNLDALVIGQFGTGFVTDAMLNESGIKQSVADVMLNVRYNKKTGVSYNGTDYNSLCTTTFAFDSNYYSNEEIAGLSANKAYLTGINFKGTTVTSVSVIAGNATGVNTLSVTHNYGTFNVVNGYAAIDDVTYKLSNTERIFVKITGTAYIKSTPTGSTAKYCASNVSTTFAGWNFNIAMIPTFDERTLTTINSDDLRKSIDTNSAGISTLQTNLNTTNNNVAGVQTYVDNVKKDSQRYPYINIFSDDFSTVKADWVNSGFTFDTTNKCIYPNATGGFISNALTNYAYLDRVYMGDKRIVRFDVTLYSDTVMNIHFRRKLDNTGEGESMYIIDVPNKKIKMCAAKNSYFEGVNLTTYAVDKSITEFDFVSGNVYGIEVEKNDYTYSLRIYDKTTGNVSEASIVGWGANRQLYNLGFTLASGTAFKVSNLKITMLDKPNVVFMGDSITEGYQCHSIVSTDANNINYRFAEQMRTKIGKVMISAASGGQIDQVLSAMDTEMAFIKPSYIVVTIGTNGGNTTAKLQSLITKANAIGATLFINHIAEMYNGAHVSVNTQIDALGTNKGCLFDVATSVANYPIVDGSHLTTIEGQTTRTDLTLFATDQLHPNRLGHDAMTKRFYIDCPEIITIS